MFCHVAGVANVPVARVDACLLLLHEIAPHAHGPCGVIACKFCLLEEIEALQAVQLVLPYKTRHTVLIPDSLGR